MAIQDFNGDTGPARRAADPRVTRRAPFPARAANHEGSELDHGGDLERLTQAARDELSSDRLLAADRRTIAWCPACGEAVRDGEDYVRDRGDLYHARCAPHRGDGDGDGRSR